MIMAHTPRHGFAIQHIQPTTMMVLEDFINQK
jgi:hypothetical protein